jgi:protein-S-isoprenylcysteine O-methyltransferase Ste14
MTEPSESRRESPRVRLRLGPLLRALLPSLVTLVLIVLLMFTMFFTDFDWQWVVFLAGILFASVLSLVSYSWKSGWRNARRAIEVDYAQGFGIALPRRVEAASVANPSSANPIPN